MTDLDGIQYTATRALSNSSQHAQNDFNVFEVEELSQERRHFVLKQSITMSLSDAEVVALASPFEWLRFGKTESGRLVDTSPHHLARQWLQETAIQHSIQEHAPGLAPIVRKAWFSASVHGKSPASLRRYSILMDHTPYTLVPFDTALSIMSGGAATPHTSARGVSPQQQERPLSRIGPLLRAISDAIQRLHAAGVVHADLQPSHIMCDPVTCTVQLIDFGVSRFTECDFNYHCDAGLDGAGIFLDFATLDTATGMATYKTDWLAFLRIIHIRSTQLEDTVDLTRCADARVKLNEFLEWTEQSIQESLFSANHLAFFLARL